jgi:hypothetical protein
MNKRILIFSYNPIPTPEYKTIEGSALRFWRMALALKENGIDDITIAVWQKFPQKIDGNEGVRITSFDDNPEKLKELMSGYDVIVYSCAMGPLSKLIYDCFPIDKLMIIDAYSPMYVEFLTKSLDKKGDDEILTHYVPYIEAFNECLMGCDYALIANDNQKHLYRGVLAGIGALPYHDDRKFITLPAFVERSANVRQKQIKKNTKINVLWFGGVYPWFDIKDIINAFSNPQIKSIANLTVVGGSNPFYPKDNIRFNGKFIQSVSLSKKLGLYGTTIVFEDWVEYYDRIETFNQSDIAISINNTFIENEYSFRLRVADLVGNGVPVITNGGDYLGEELINQKVAFRLDISTSKKLETSLKNILQDSNSINNAKKLLQSENTYQIVHIYKYIDNLLGVINENTKQKTNRKNAKKIINLGKSETTESTLPKYLDEDLVQFVPTANLLRVTTSRVKKAILVKTKKVIKR